MTSLVYSGRNNWRAVTGWELGAPWIRSGCTSWTPARLIRANTPWSYSMGTAPTNCQQTCLGKVSWVTPELLSRSPSNPGQGFLSPLLEMELQFHVELDPVKGPQKYEEMGSRQEKGLKPLGSLGTAEERMSRRQLLLGCSSSSRAHRRHLENENFQVYKRFCKPLGVFFLLWTSLWKGRTQSRLFQPCTNRAVLPWGRDR